MVGFVSRSFDALAGFGEADLRAAFSAFRQSAARLSDGAFDTGSLGIRAAAYRPAAAAALAAGAIDDPAAARQFFATHFVPVALRPETGQGFLTGYYEPVVEASRVKTAAFGFPLYGRPKDLIKIDAINRPPGFDPDMRFARQLDCGMIGEYFDRAAIEAGALKGRGLEIAWLKSKIDAFFIHVQGSARLHMQDGSDMRVGYVAKSGQAFTAIGRSLVEEGALTLAEADMAGIRRWLDQHPDRRDEVLNRNRSFIFFAIMPVNDPALGPIGAAKVPLTPLASIAVDRLLATYGVPYFIASDSLMIEAKPFRRVMVAQDTGSAILGPARADIFVGTGDAAGALAGTIRHAADFHVLVPPDLATELVR
ncbi:MltA domain-containing protein [Jiella sp. MQZ9-1]|uniref:peptidoglycan lytic exotransglycosylase n=1 Tax=Jiella flava TaxID=2816857 RepID=A0A939JUS8_9HYPH|nr:MltA domain-containing protein [Jiella flava]MBO0663485.1 MltA domain-containing protein [Jiella flava]MCD2472060.1 MltA domain-containing protein [Jiella flava]